MTRSDARHEHESGHSARGPDRGPAVKRMTRRRPLAVLGIVMVLAGAGGAIAYWAGVGHGTAETALQDPEDLRLIPGTLSALLVPGDDASVETVATNPNPYSVKIGALALDTGAGTGGFEVDAAHDGCVDQADVAFQAQDNDGLGWLVPPRAGATDGTLPIDMPHAVTMGLHAANACQGAVFTIHLIAGD